MILLSQEEFNQLQEISKSVLGPACQDVGLTTFYESAAKLVNVKKGHYQNKIVGQYLISERSVNYFYENIRNKYGASQESGEKVNVLEEAARSWRNSILNRLKAEVVQKSSGNKERDSKGVANAYAREIDNQVPVNILEAFQVSIWYGYERMENGIGRKKISFGVFQGLHCQVDIESPEEDITTWEGEAEYSHEEELLAIRTRNSTTKKDYTHFLFKVDGVKKNHDVCIGHMTYKNRELGNIVSKTIVMLRTKPDADTFPATFDFNSREVEQTIRTFFKDRTLNRMSSPHKGKVYNLLSLQQWIDQNKDPKRYIHKPVLGKYDVYSKGKPKDKGLIKYKLEILEENNSLYVRFIENIANGETEMLEGVASINFERHVLTALLKSGAPSDDSVRTILEEDYTFLLLNLPIRSIKKIDTLIGIATGPRNNNKGSVSRLMILVKKTQGKNPPDFNINQLKTFFDYFQKRLRVRPPVTHHIHAIYKFNQIVTVINDYKRRFGNDPD